MTVPLRYPRCGLRLLEREGRSTTAVFRQIEKALASQNFMQLEYVRREIERMRRGR
jgi:hypothetical protein